MNVPVRRATQTARGDGALRLAPVAGPKADVRACEQVHGPLEPPLEYELRGLEPPSSARVTAELDDGRFTVATDQPHVKVAWRISRRKEEPR